MLNVIKRTSLLHSKGKVRVMTKAHNLTHQDKMMKYFSGIKHTSLLLINGKVSSLIKAHVLTFKDVNLYLFETH
jgi:hypothetical protein